MTAALLRLDALHDCGLLAAAEHQVAREAMLGAMEGVGEGRSLRVEAYQALGPKAGSPIILMNVLTKIRLCKYDWTRLALDVDSHGLRNRLLGLAYDSAPELWDELLTKLEHLAQSRQEEHLSQDRFDTVKYGTLGRSRWLALVGELVWLRREVDGLEVWWREDGWYVSEESVDSTVDRLMQRTRHEASPLRDQRIHQYFDWIQDQCWRRYNDVIADGDARYLRSEGLQRLDDGVWSFGSWTD